MKLSKYYEPEFVDFEDLKDLGEAINAARKALYNITLDLSESERKYRSAEYKYSVAMRRSISSSDLKTATDKKIEAEIENEDLELVMLKSKIMYDQLKRAADLLRSELQTLQTISNNVRQQLKIL